MWTFQNPSHFCKWLGERKGNPAELYIRGVPARGGRGSTEVAQFLAKQLQLPNPLHRWQKWKVAYLMKQCGHRSGEEGAVCEAQPLESLTEDRRAPTPFEPGTSNGGANILEDDSAIVCDETAFLDSEHTTAVTSSGRGYIRRFAPELNERAPVVASRPSRPPLCPTAAAFRNSSTFPGGKGSYKVERQTLACSFSCLAP